MVLEVGGESGLVIAGGHGRPGVVDGGVCPKQSPGAADYDVYDLGRSGLGARPLQQLLGAA